MTDEQEVREFHKMILKKLNEQGHLLDEIVRCQRKQQCSIDGLHQDTEGVVQLYNDLQGATRLGISVQRFGIWILKWPLVGAGLYTVWHWIIQNLPPR